MSQDIRWISFEEAQERYGGGGGGLLQVVSLTLTDAQIKSLPTTPVQIIPAAGASKFIQNLFTLVISDATAGAYTNVNSSAFFSIQVGTSPNATESGPNPTGWVLTDNSQLWQFTLPFLSQISGDGSTPITSAAPVTGSQGDNVATDSALFLKLNNQGDGNLTGGNAANTLKAIAYYVVADLS